MPENDGDTRYGHRAGSGANEPKRHEEKEQAPDWRPGQGGDQTRSDPEKQRELEDQREATLRPEAEGADPGRTPISKKAKPGRGQLHSRSERSWRDETNPSGTTATPDQLAPTAGTGVEPARAGRQGIEASDDGLVDQTTSTDGPGGGGATEWSGRAKHHEGLHGGPSRRK